MDLLVNLGEQRHHITNEVIPDILADEESTRICSSLRGDMALTSKRHESFVACYGTMVIMVVAAPNMRCMREPVVSAQYNREVVWSAPHAILAACQCLCLLCLFHLLVNFPQLCDNHFEHSGVDPAFHKCLRNCRGMALASDLAHGLIHFRRRV